MKKCSLTFILIMTLFLSFIPSTQSQAACDNNFLSDDVSFSIIPIETTSTGIESRAVKGYNYAFEIQNDNTEDIIASVTGTVTFNINNGTARVASAPTPTVKKYNNNYIVTATASPSSSGNTALCRINMGVSVYGVFYKTNSVTISCDGGGVISIKYH